MGDSKTVGRIVAKALGWFIGASFCSLLLGLLFANLLQPGAALGVPLPESAAGQPEDRRAEPQDFITHVFPKSIFEAMGQRNPADPGLRRLLRPGPRPPAQPDRPFAGAPWTKWCV